MDDDMRNKSLILPNGDRVDIEIFKSCGYKITEYMKRYELSATEGASASRKCLNMSSQAKSKAQAVYNQLSNRIQNKNLKLDAEMVVRLILTELVEEIVRNYDGPILADYMNRWCQIESILEILNQTIILRNIHLTELQTSEQITCFLINLTNLLFLHALISHPIESNMDVFVSMNWLSRQVYFNSVGYFVGRLGFVSLCDLHSYLLHLPTLVDHSTLSSLDYTADPRVPFAIAQPYALSPQIRIACPDTIDAYLDLCQTEYLNFCSSLNENSALVVPIPLLLHIERSCFEAELMPRSFQNAPLIRQKVDFLSQLMRKNFLKCEDVIQTGVLLVYEPQFTVNFSYSNLLMLGLHSYRQILWKFCCYHASFMHCVQDLASTVKAALFETYYDQFPDYSVDQIDKKIHWTDVYQKIDILAAHFKMEFQYDVVNCPDNMRCLFNALLFLAGEIDSPKAVDDTELENIFLFLKTIADKKTSISETYAKIRACEKVLMLDRNIFSQKLSWRQLFVEDASAILSTIVEQQDVKLAMEFVDAQSIYNPFYEFNKEIYAQFLALLSQVSDIKVLQAYIAPLSESNLVQIIDKLIEKQCQISRLSILVNGVLRVHALNDDGILKFYTLWMALRMVAVISSHEQLSFYEILHHPKLIVEQLIINKYTATLKMVLNIPRNAIVEHRLVTELEAAFQDNVDALLLLYAEKALYFSKNPEVNSDGQSEADRSTRTAFPPPRNVPPVDQWVPDERTCHCTLCKRRFNVFTRRHHCRRCGRIFCYFCSTQKLQIDTYDVPVRVCDNCFEYEKPAQIMYNGKRTDPNCSPCPEIFWRLSPNESANNNIRRKIEFDTGPDINLCMSFLELHSPNNSAARFLCGKAEEMTKILRHRLVFSANFNYKEVTSCARSLTIGAKILFSHLNDLRGIRRCEEMVSEIELLNVCSSIEYVPVDPNKPMRDVEQWNLIKDKLTNLGQWKKALEVVDN